MSHTFVDEVAADLVRGERRKTYGAPSVSFEAIAEAWNAYIRNKAGGDMVAPRTDDVFELEGHDVAMLMTMMKCLRNAPVYGRDNVVDIVGYAILDEVLSEDAAREEFES